MTARSERMNLTGYLGSAVLVLLLSYVVQDLFRPDVLLVGNITIDLVDGTRPTGGAVSYGASILKAYGIRACIVTVAGPDADLSIFDGHELYVIKSDSTLTFEHTYTRVGHTRKLRVTANPNITVTRAHVPLHCQRARTVILGPLTLHDLDAGSFLTHDGIWSRLLRGRQAVGLMAQGFQRSLDPEGEVLAMEEPSKRLLDGLGPQVSVFLSDVETDSWAPRDVERVTHGSARLLVTRGKKGADEHNTTGVHNIPIVDVDRVIDTNGAGDTFATAYMVALARGLPDPGLHASWAASRTVTQPQSCKPHCAGSLITGNVPHQTLWKRVGASFRDGWHELQAAGDVARQGAGQGAELLSQHTQQLRQRVSSLFAVATDAT